MSDVKLKLVDDKGYVCKGCYYHNTGECPEFYCFEDDKIWVIDDSAIETDNPKSPWVKIEDAELVDGDEYRISDGKSVKFIGVYVESFHEFMVLTTDKFLPPVNAEIITHVIHLPKPTPPSEL